MDSLKEPRPVNIYQEFHLIFPSLSHYQLQEAGVNAVRERNKKVTKFLMRKSKGNENEFIRILLCFGQVYYFLCRRELATYCTLKALYIADQSNSVSSELRRSINSCIITSGMTDNPSFGKSYIHIGRLLFKDQWDRRALQAEAMFQSGYGHLDRSIDPFDKAQKVGNISEAFKRSQEVHKLGKDSWTVYFTCLGIYYSLLTRIFILLFFINGY